MAEAVHGAQVAYLRLVRPTVQDFDRLDRALREVWQQHEGAAAKRLGSVGKELESLKQRKTQILDLFADGNVSQSDYNERRAGLDADIDRLERELADSEWQPLPFNELMAYRRF